MNRNENEIYGNCLYYKQKQKFLFAEAGYIDGGFVDVNFGVFCDGSDDEMKMGMLVNARSRVEIG